MWGVRQQSLFSQLHMAVLVAGTQTVKMAQQTAQLRPGYGSHELLQFSVMTGSSFCSVTFLFFKLTIACQDVYNFVKICARDSMMCRSVTFLHFILQGEQGQDICC